VGIIDVTEGFRRARDDAERAIALDPTSASGYLALARTQIDYDWDWDAASTCLAKAAALEPGNVEVFSIRSYLFRLSGNPAEAIKQYEKAVALDPLRSNSHLGLGYLLYVARRYEQGQAEVQRALDLNPQVALAHLTRSKILVAQGKPQQALTEIESETLEWAKLTGKALVYHALGRAQDSDAAVAGLIAKYGTQAAFQISQAYAFRGESDKSFEWLERAYQQRDAGLPEIKDDPLLNNVRRDPRFAALLTRMRLSK